MSSEIPPRLTPQEEQEKEREEPTAPFSKKVSLKDVKKEDIMNYAKSNTLDTVAYGIMLLGIILLLFAPPVGQVLVGAVGGFYFGQELIAFLKNLRTYLEEEPIVRSLIFAGVCLALFIGSPLLFIAAIVAALLRQLWLNYKG